MKTYAAPLRPVVSRLPAGVTRARPRGYAEWSALRRWRKLPDWDPSPPGYLLRVARERSKLTQQALAERLGCAQQAIAQAERWGSNPTIAFIRRWAEACGTEIRIELEREKRLTRSVRK
jgi:DNA-binding XRE family transcriptional regulator